MGIMELFDIGFFTTFWNWSSPILTMLIYSSVVLGFIIQFLLRRKCHKPILRWMLVILCTIGIIVSECVWQVITGWERLSVDMFYGLFICILLGAMIENVVFKFKSRINVVSCEK